jgi:hypothetical protein
MSLEIINIRSGAGSKNHTSVGTSGTQAFVSKHSGRVVVDVAHPSNGARYLRTQADGKWSDDLLALLLSKVHARPAAAAPYPNRNLRAVRKTYNELMTEVCGFITMLGSWCRTMPDEWFTPAEKGPIPIQPNGALDVRHR